MNALGCLGRYELIREIARSNDVVWEAWDPLTNRRVAIKELMIPQGATSEEAAERTERFQREARAVASLNHPAIVSLYDFGVTGSRRFIVLELMEAGTLAVEIARGPMAPKRISHVFVQLLGALDIAHRAGIIHRDIKPQNIFLLPDGRVKLGDFGIASLATERTITLTGNALGTLHYLSPEQANGDKVGASSDVWAAGVVMFEAATGGLRPFEGSSIVDVVRRIATSEPDWSLLRGNVPRDLIKKALAKSPRERYSSAMEYLTAVRDWQEAKAIGAVSQASAPKIGVQPAAPNPAPQIQRRAATPIPQINQAQAHAPQPPQVVRQAQPTSRNTSLAWLVGLGFLVFFFVRGIDNVRAANATQPPPQSYPSFEPGGDKDSTTTTGSADTAEGANSVVGTWTNDGKDIADQVVEFKDDGTATVTGTVPALKNAKAEAGMTYKIDGDKMTEKMTSEKLTASDDADAATKKQIDEANAGATPDALAMQPEQTDTIKWSDKDSFSLTGTGGKVTTFTRKTPSTDLPGSLPAEEQDATDAPPNDRESSDGSAGTADSAKSVQPSPDRPTKALDTAPDEDKAVGEAPPLTGSVKATQVQTQRIGPSGRAPFSWNLPAAWSEPAAAGTKYGVRYQARRGRAACFVDFSTDIPASLDSFAVSYDRKWSLSTHSQYKLRNMGWTTFGGVRAFLWSFTKLENGQIQQKYIYYFTAGNGYFAVAFVAPEGDWSLYLNDFDSIAASFRAING